MYPPSEYVSICLVPERDLVPLISWQESDIIGDKCISCCRDWIDVLLISSLAPSQGNTWPSGALLG